MQDAITFTGVSQACIAFLSLFSWFDLTRSVGAQVASREGQRAAYLFERGTITASELIGRITAHYRIRDLEVREPDIESTVRRIYEERLLEKGTAT